MSELQDHIKAHNAETQAWIDEDPTNRIAGMIVEEDEHWAKYDIHTVAQYEQFMMDATYSDLHKEVFGCRPRRGGHVTQEEFDSLIKMHEIEMEEEAERKEESKKEFEALLADTIERGAGDRKTAIRWIRDAGGDDQLKYDDGYFEYCNGLPYGYLAKEEGK